MFHDDRILAVLLLIAGGARVAIAFAQDEVFGAESTLALIMVVVGLGLLLRRK